MEYTSACTSACMEVLKDLLSPQLQHDDMHHFILLSAKSCLAEWPAPIVILLEHRSPQDPKPVKPRTSSVDKVSHGWSSKLGSLFGL